MPASNAFIMRSSIAEFDTNDYAEELSRAELVPDTQVEQLKLLKGNTVSDVDNPSWTFAISGIQDWTVTQGCGDFLSASRGGKVDVTFQPRLGTGQRTATFSVIAMSPNFGGEQGSAQPRLESNFDLLAVVSVEEVAQALRDSPILDTGDRERPRRVVHIGHSVALEQLQLLYLRVRHQLGAGQLFGVVVGVKLSDRGSHDKGVASRHGPYSLLTYSSTAGISPLSVLTVAGCTRCAYPAPVRLNSAVILGSNSSSRSTAAPWSPPSTITTRHSPDHAAPGPRSPRSNNTHAEPARIARGWSSNAVMPSI